MNFKNQTSQRIISTLIIIFILAPAVLFSRPKEAGAWWWSTWSTDISAAATTGTTGVSAGANTTETAFSIKNFAKEILRQVAMTIARKALQGITKSTINWINTGNWGNPLFVENPQSFFKDIAKYEIRTLVDAIGYDSLRYPFGKDFALNIINSYNRQAQENSQYTLSKVIQDPVLLKSYRNDFNVGGWNGFLINTQYPQNNYLGFQMIETEKLGRKLAGTTQTATEKVKKTLDQGMGFLSPETCADNGGDNEYNKVMANQFKRPTFNASKEVPYEPPAPPQLMASEADYNAARARYLTELANYDISHEIDVENAKGEWEKTNTCKRLVATTPGSVVASQITTSMGSLVRNKELAAAMGNSMSAIFDSLLTKFIGDGLSSLSSNTNPPPENPDDWDYYGNKLGVASDQTYASWDSGPDEEIKLDAFKQAINEGIASTEEELSLIFNDDDLDGDEVLDNPGIIQMIGAIWPKTRTLDICLPGPDIGWEDRVQKEVERNSKALQEKLMDEDAELSLKADLTLKELMFAASFFKDWVNNKMMTELPKSVIFMDAVEEIETLYQQSNELTDARRLKIQALARLGAIKNGLDNFTDQPESGSEGEKILIKLKKQYDATRDTVSTSYSIDAKQNELNIAQDKYTKLGNLISECETERVAKNWSRQGGRNSVKSENNNAVTEEILFCDAPIIEGYTHNMFRGPDTMRPKLPMVNAKNVMSWDKFGWFTGTREVDINMNCDLIFKANILDYKKDLPGETTVTEEFEDLSRDPGSGGGDTGPGTPESEPDSAGAVCAAVAEERGKYGSTVTEAEEAKILISATSKFSSDGWGVLYRGGTTHCPSVYGDMACDIIYHGESCILYDVFLGDSRDRPGANIANTSCFIADGYGGAGNKYPGNRSGWRGDSKDWSQVPVSTVPCTFFNQTGGGDTGGTNPTEPTPPPPNPNPTSGNPYINSVIPTTATPGVTTITIKGTNLSTVNKTTTTTVQFFYGPTGKTSVDGTVNSAKTEVTVLVPAEVTSRATIKVYRDSTIQSNPVEINISGTGTGGGTIGTPIQTLAEKNLGPGTFPDVAFFNGRIYLAVQRGINDLVLYNFATDLSDQKSVQIPYIGDEAFPRLTVSNNVLWLGFRPNSGVVLWRSDTQTIENLGGGFGTHPVALGNGFVAWQKDGKVQRRSLGGGAITAVRDAVATGISRILANGSIKMIDEDRLAVSGYTKPWIAGGLTITEGKDSGLFGFWNNPSSPFTITSNKFTMFPGQVSFVPTAATNGTLYAVATWGTPGVRVATIQKTPTGGTPAPIAVPVLTTLERVSDTLVITGTNLTSKVLFNNSNDTPYKTYTGSVNTAKTETRLQIPADIELDKEYLVKIQKTSTPTATSNGLKITIPRPDPASCTFNIPFTFNTITPLGKTESFDIDTQAGCAWTTKSSASWIKVTSGASVTGDGTVKVTISPNISKTATSRTGTLKVADKTLSVTQQGEKCAYTATPTTTGALSPDGGTATITVKTQSVCSWIATESATWLSITSGASGTGNGTVKISAISNRNATATTRASDVKIEDKTVTINQSAGVCTFTVDSSAVSSALNAGEHDVFMDVTTQSSCAWTAKSNTSWITVTDGASDTGNGTVSVSIGANSGSSNRSGTLTIAGKTIIVTQMKP